MSNEFSEFFDELGGIENLKLMVNMREIVYGEILQSPAVDFTIGWGKRFEFRVLKRKSMYSGYSDNFYNYFVYVKEGTYLIYPFEIKSQMPSIIKHKTGYEINF